MEEFNVQCIWHVDCIGETAVPFPLNHIGQNRSWRVECMEVFIGDRLQSLPLHCTHTHSVCAQYKSSVGTVNPLQQVMHLTVDLQSKICHIVSRHNAAHLPALRVTSICCQTGASVYSACRMIHTSVLTGKFRCSTPSSRESDNWVMSK